MVGSAEVDLDLVEDLVEEEVVVTLEVIAEVEPMVV